MAASGLHNDHMAGLTDSRLVFSIVVGSTGVGERGWKRSSYDLLPDRYYDQDAVAGGTGDWNSEEARAARGCWWMPTSTSPTLERLDFGMESTYCGVPGRRLAKRVIEAGYRDEGLYLATNNPSVNVKERVLANTGHRVDPRRIPCRWKYSLSNLWRTAGQFDSLRLFNNSEEHDTALREPPEQCEPKRERAVWKGNEPAAWCSAWVSSLEQSCRSLRGHRAKVARAAASRQREPRDSSGAAAFPRERLFTRRG